MKYSRTKSDNSRYPPVFDPNPAYPLQEVDSAWIILGSGPVEASRATKFIDEGARESRQCDYEREVGRVPPLSLYSQTVGGGEAAASGQRVR